MIAVVYRQDTPTPIRGQFGTGEMYAANLVQVGTVSGTRNECWDQAKKLCKAPVMEWKGDSHENRS